MKPAYKCSPNRRERGCGAFDRHQNGAIGPLSASRDNPPDRRKFQMAASCNTKTLLMILGAALALSACGGGADRVASPGEGAFPPPPTTPPPDRKSTRLNSSH